MIMHETVFTLHTAVAMVTGIMIGCTHAHHHGMFPHVNQAQNCDTALVQYTELDHYPVVMRP